LSGISTLIILIFYIYHDEIHHAIKRLRRQEGKPLDGQEGQKP
jgi:hypothetical protein